MKRSTSGFTIVELLIVIVVIGILAAITIVSYTGIQDRATNAAKLAEMKAWKKQFELYQVMFGSFPAAPDGSYCLGSGFPDGKCRDYESSDPTRYYLETDPDGLAIQNELKKVATPPSGPREGTGYSVGPYINYTGHADWGFYIVNFFSGASGSCPDGMEEWWYDADRNSVMCAEIVKTN